MKRVLSIMTILLAVFNYGQNSAENFKTTDFDVAIFPEEYSEMMPNKRFSPSQEDVLKAEKALRLKLKEINKDLINQSSSPVIHKNLKKYKRQYFGFYDEDGRQYLLINAFWSDNDYNHDWLHTRIIILDGGSYYWNIKYYIDLDDLKELNVNGCA